MTRTLFACAIFCLATVGASAADPKVDRAISVFGEVGRDPGKLKTYCEMSDAAEAQGDRDDDASEAEIDGYLDKLGPDFEEAWETSEDSDENSTDGRRLNAALDELENQCPDD